jgi:hypothetical protein
MMAGQYQGGPSVDVLSTQGKKAEALYKSFGSVKKVAAPAWLAPFSPRPPTLPTPRPLPAPIFRHPAGGKHGLPNSMYDSSPPKCSISISSPDLSHDGGGALPRVTNSGMHWGGVLRVQAPYIVHQSTRKDRIAFPVSRSLYGARSNLGGAPVEIRRLPRDCLDLLSGFM